MLFATFFSALMLVTDVTNQQNESMGWRLVVGNIILFLLAVAQAASQLPFVTKALSRLRNKLLGSLLTMFEDQWAKHQQHTQQQV